MGKRVLAGTLIGAAAGGALGVLAGLLVFQPASRAVWGATVAGLVFGVLFALVLSGMSALGSPPPGQEPEDPGRPDREVPGFTRDERAVNPGTSERSPRHLRPRSGSSLSTAAAANPSRGAVVQPSDASRS
jgi:hypothetical protein